MKQVILDTNFFLIPFQFHVDVFSEIRRLMMEPYELCVLDKSLNELMNIASKQKGKSREYAKMAFELAGRAMEIETGDGIVDDLLVDMADENTVVCTQDKELRKRLKEKKAKTIGLRQKNHLAFI